MRRLTLAAAFAVLLTAFGLQAPSAQAAEKLVGLFKLTPGSWSGSADDGKVSGTYFRMMQPDGKTYLTNGDSRAANKSYTILSPGTDGGLRTGTYQSTPSPAFNSDGDALSGKVTAPEDFFGVKFATATNKKDPQTGKTTAVPTITRDGSKLSGDLRAFAASWNKQHFNQGAPKPDGKKPGFTKEVSGTYNASTKAFTITWRSLIVGGPFDKFTGEWHLVGTFVPDSSAESTGADDDDDDSTSTTNDNDDNDSSTDNDDNSSSSSDSSTSSTDSATATPTSTATDAATPAADGATPAPAATEVAVAGQETWDDDSATDGPPSGAGKVFGGIAGVIAIALLVWFFVVQRLKAQSSRRSRFNR
jgi:hypothetical protein